MFSNKGNIAESVNIYQTDSFFLLLFNMSVHNKQVDVSSHSHTYTCIEKES